MRVIDISQFNGSTNFTKSTNVEGIIIRVGYRGYGSSAKLVEDKKFKKNIEAAEYAGFKLGVYFVTQAVTETEGKNEADFVLDLIKGYKLPLGVWFDSENGNGGKGRADINKITKAQRTTIARAFCKKIEEAGYMAGVYASQSWFNDCFNLYDLKGVKKWVAKYSDNAPSIDWDGWQYTSKGKTEIVSGNVDISSFKDSILEVKAEDTKKTNDEIAQEVINGKWGDGAERARRLTDAGYNYTEIQALVNKLVGSTASQVKDNAVYYTVKRGDTLSGIARKFNTTVPYLQKINNIKNANKINIGQVLKVRE